MTAWAAKVLAPQPARRKAAQAAAYTLSAPIAASPRDHRHDRDRLIATPEKIFPAGRHPSGAFLTSGKSSIRGRLATLRMHRGQRNGNLRRHASARAGSDLAIATALISCAPRAR